MEKKHPQRTKHQNRALHLYFTLLAEALNNAGLDQRKVLKPSVAIPWDAKSVKDQLWRQIQQAQVHKRSTTELDTKETTLIYETLNRHLGEKFGVSILWPSEDHITFYYNEKTN